MKCTILKPANLNGSGKITANIFLRAELADRYQVCPECDLLLNRRILSPGNKAHCPRCGYTLQRSHKHSIERTLALSVAGLILLIPANTLTMLSVKILGKSQDGNLWSGILGLFSEEMWVVAVLVLLSSVILPCVNLALAFLLGLHLFSGKTSPHLSIWMRWYQHLYEWAMLEIYALGIIVACVKLADMATIKFGFGLYAFVGLIVCNAMLANEFDSTTFWRQIAQLTRHKS